MSGKRPPLSDRANEIMEMFLERHIFTKQTDVMEAALEALLEQQLRKEAEESEYQVPEYLVQEQLKVASGS